MNLKRATKRINKLLPKILEMAYFPISSMPLRGFDEENKEKIIKTKLK